MLYPVTIHCTVYTDTAAAAAADCKQLDDKTHQWQYEEKPGTWIIFDNDTQKELTKAYNDKEEEVRNHNGEGS